MAVEMFLQTSTVAGLGSGRCLALVEEYQAATVTLMLDFHSWTDRVPSCSTTVEFPSFLSFSTEKQLDQLNMPETSFNKKNHLFIVMKCTLSINRSVSQVVNVLEQTLINHHHRHIVIVHRTKSQHHNTHTHSQTENIMNSTCTHCTHKQQHCIIVTLKTKAISSHH